LREIGDVRGVKTVLSAKKLRERFSGIEAWKKPIVNLRADQGAAGKSGQRNFASLMIR
jgi:hypothetical protein